MDVRPKSVEQDIIAKIVKISISVSLALNKKWNPTTQTTNSTRSLLWMLSRSLLKKNGEQIDSFFRPGSPNDPVEKIVHNAYCDRCNQTIVGIRWKCLECNNFDFCNACYLVANGKENIKYHLKDHQLAKIEDPSTYPQSFFQQRLINQQNLEREKLQSQLNNTNIPNNTNNTNVNVTIPVKQEEKPIEQPKEEPKEEPNSFSKKLEDLSLMGFSDRKLNIKLLIENKLNLSSTIEQLLN